MKTEIERGQVTISELKGKLSVNLVDSILFESGKAEVKKGGRRSWPRSSRSSRRSRTRPSASRGTPTTWRSRASLAKRYPTNWELSAARAINVARFLQRQGVPAERLSAIAYGEWKPVGDNDSPEGRAKNRRIEIILVDKEQP